MLRQESVEQEEIRKSSLVGRLAILLGTKSGGETSEPVVLIVDIVCHLLQVLQVGPATRTGSPMTFLDAKTDFKLIIIINII